MYRRTCQCCHTFTGCTIVQDSFERADSTDVGSEWLEVAGDWSISGNAVTVTATDGLLIAAATRATYFAHYLVDATLSDGGRLVFDYLDADNWYALQYLKGIGRVYLYQCSGGMVSFQDSLLTISSQPASISLRVCVNGSTLIVNRGTNAIVRTFTPFGGNRAGVGCASGSVTIDDFLFSYDRSDDPTCPFCNANCTTCADNSQTLTEYLVDLANFTFTSNQGSNDCARCEAISGEFTVAATPTGCLWQYVEQDFCGSGCTDPDCLPLADLVITLKLIPLGSGDCRLEVRISLSINSAPNCDTATCDAFVALYELDTSGASFDMLNLDATLNLISSTQTNCAGTFPATISVRTP